LVSHDLAALLDPESDDRIAAKPVTAANREFVSEEKQIVINLLDRLLGPGPNKRPQSGPPPQFKSVEDSPLLSSPVAHPDLEPRPYHRGLRIQGSPFTEILLASEGAC